MASLTVYDGANGIGGNKIFVEENDRGVFLDFGKNFGKYGQFYEEFLKSRDTRGIHDLMYLDLLPKLNIYRPDIIPADLSIGQYPEPNVAAVLLSHAHMDHCGNIGMLRKDIPIVASPESIVIMKGMQEDAGISSLEADTAYFSTRKPADDKGFYLESVSGMSYQGKDFCCTEPPSEALASFLCRRPGQDGKKAKKLEAGMCCCYDETEFPFEISAHPVDHSIFGATAYILRGETTIAYTGDFRLHGKKRAATREFVSKAKDIYMLHNLQCISGSCTTEGLCIYDEIVDKSRRKWEQEVVQANYGDRYVSHEAIRSNPDNYILCFSFFDMKHLLDIKPEGWTYIYSGCEAFNEEMEIDFKRLWLWLKRFNLDSSGFWLDENEVPCFDKRYNASGHASGEDITWAIEQIDPDYIVPIHTEEREWFAKNFENVILVEEGRPWDF